MPSSSRNQLSDESFPTESTTKSYLSIMIDVIIFYEQQHENYSYYYTDSYTDIVCHFVDYR